MMILEVQVSYRIDDEVLTEDEQEALHKKLINDLTTLGFTIEYTDIY